MFKFVLGLVMFTASSISFAAGVEGQWRTESNKAGGYLEVTMGACEEDAKKTCGIITNAFTENGPDSDYENLGKPIVMDMHTEDGNKFSGGTIWDPEHDKTYKSKMTLKEDDLDVEGCVSIVCSGQDWKRIK